MSSEVAATLIDRYNCNRLTVMMYVGGSYHLPICTSLFFHLSRAHDIHIYMYFFSSITQGGGTPHTPPARGSTSNQYDVSIKYITFQIFYHVGYPKDGYFCVAAID